nr:methionine biosynthesis protein MetW [uncultured Dongia sp.]
MALEESETAAAKRIRVDLQLIADMVRPRSRVLDIGCGDGVLLDYLVHMKQVDGRGMELSQAGVNAGVAQGLSIIQGDADTDLDAYPSDAFDYVILSQTLQATRDPRRVVEQLVRIGRRAIVSFPNFGHWRVRWKLGWTGRMPETDSMPLKWYNTPNIHFCTIQDFLDLCTELDVEIEKAMVIDASGQPGAFTSRWRANLLGEQGMFLLKKRGG